MVTNILEVVKITVADVLGLDYNQREAMCLDSDFVKEYGADSLDIMEIIFNVQKNLGINLSSDQETRLDETIHAHPTVGTLVYFFDSGKSNFYSVSPQKQPQKTNKQSQRTPQRPESNEKLFDKITELKTKMFTVKPARNQNK